MKKIFTEENIIGFAVAIVAGLVAIAIYSRLPAGKVKSLISGS